MKMMRPQNPNNNTDSQQNNKEVPMMTSRTQSATIQELAQHLTCFQNYDRSRLLKQRWNTTAGAQNTTKSVSRIRTISISDVRTMPQLSIGSLSYLNTQFFNLNYFGQCKVWLWWVEYWRTLGSTFSCKRIWCHINLHGSKMRNYQRI